MVEEHQHRQIPARFGGQQGLHTGVAGALVVQPRRADQITLRADDPRRREVVGHKVGRQQIPRRHAGPLGDVVTQGPRSTSGAPDGVEVALWVDSDRGPVLGEMDGQLRHPQQRLVDPDQLLADPTLGIGVADREPAAEPEVSVQPGVQPCPAIGLQGHHLPARHHPVGMLFDPQVGAVGVRADDPEGQPATRPAPGEHRTAAHGEEPAPVGAAPTVGLGQFGVAGRAQPSGNGGADVERRRGGVDELA